MFVAVRTVLFITRENDVRGIGDCPTERLTTILQMDERREEFGYRTRRESKRAFAFVLVSLTLSHFYHNPQERGSNCKCDQRIQLKIESTAETGIARNQYISFASLVFSI